MTTLKADIVIIGAGIAGLWSFHHLKRMGYDVLLLDRSSIGCGQTIASQGIIHSGLKYAFAGKVNKLARSISAMPDLWHAAFKGKGHVNLSSAYMATESQYLLIPRGFMGGLIKLVTNRGLGNSVHECPKVKWPEELKASGFKGSMIYMDEPVLDIPSVLRALAEPYKKSIRKVDTFSFTADHRALTVGSDDNKVTIEAKRFIFTAAGSNYDIAKKAGHEAGLHTQKRPLLMGMIKNAPYPLFAHLVGSSDKPVATITTHSTEDGSLVWYLGGNVAERAKEDDPQEVYTAALKGFKKYMPKLDLSDVRWASLPIDRVEGKSKIDNWLPDTPSIHNCGNALYCWPTKLTFAPMLSDMIVKHLNEAGIKPSHTTSDWSALPPCPYTKTPWDEAKWTRKS